MFQDKNIPKTPISCLHSHHYHHQDFIFNEGNYSFSVHESNSILLYNPKKILPINLNLFPNSWVISVIISIKKWYNLL